MSRARWPSEAQYPPLSPEDARLIEEVIHDYCGLSHGLDSSFLLERRVAPRMRALGLGSHREYYHYLRYDPSGGEELEALVEHLTTHETYFFREQYQLDSFRTELVPELVGRGDRPRSLTVWSAGCSTGEEAYTLAILLRETPALRAWNLRVVGSDISRKVVARARAGSYGPASFRSMSPALRERYFVPENGRWSIRDDIRSMCSFGTLNLVSQERFHAVGRCDVIFCRNVLMYLGPSARERIVDGFYETLRPGGYLLLGHSESLLNVTTRFDLVHLRQDLVYRRPES